MTDHIVVFVLCLYVNVSKFDSFFYCSFLSSVSVEGVKHIESFKIPQINVILSCSN